jgi:hypothetical protein
MVRRLVAFVVAALVMAVLGAAMHSLFVQEAWLAAATQANTGYPAALTVSDRLAWIGHDIVGMHFGTAPNAPPYGVLTSVGLLVAFFAAGLVARFTGLRLIVFAVAGAVAMFVLFTALKAALGTVGVFGARGTFGLAGQMVVGAIAGFVFARMTQPAH